MSDPRNDAHDKKVSQEKKHHPAAVATEAAADPAVETVAPGETPDAKQSATLASSLTVLGKLKDMEGHSRANLERLAELSLTVEDELKQKDLAVSLGDVYAAQNAFQEKLTVMIEAYKAECDRMQA